MHGPSPSPHRRGSRRELKIIGAVLALLLVVGIASLHLLGWRARVVLSGSMEPTYPVGSLAVVRPITAGTVRIGQPITFRHPVHDVVFTHRVIEVVKRGGQPAFRTQGDANDAADPWLVPASALEGRVVARVPAVGGWIHGFVGSAALTWMIGLAGGAIVGGELVELVRQLSARRHDVPATVNP